ncbi:DUF3862 domain-containing protein [Gallaecimonas sp. GXIMD4217]|uniref:DUF3862 domain-containing protein n=1 Tax=Gallaecimonas sp. GXIMD4217 TaxID=3131927 RepID=UPI00311B17A6
MMKRWLMPLTLVALLAGCSKVTVENYNKLEVGMSYSEVESLLGSPDQCSDAVLSARSCDWVSGDKKITIKIVSDKVAFYNAEGL